MLRFVTRHNQNYLVLITVDPFCDAQTRFEQIHQVMFKNPKISLDAIKEVWNELCKLARLLKARPWFRGSQVVEFFKSKLFAMLGLFYMFFERDEYREALFCHRFRAQINGADSFSEFFRK